MRGNIMKNINKNQLKKSIFMEAEDFVELAHTLTDIWVYSLDTDGILFDEEYDYDDALTSIEEALSEYFDVEVTSIHTDNSADNLGVWIVYRDQEIAEEQEAEEQTPYLIESSIDFSSVQVRNNVVYGECECHVFQTHEDYLNDDYEVSYDAVFTYENGRLYLSSSSPEAVFDVAFMDDLEDNFCNNVLPYKENYKISNDKEFNYSKYLIDDEDVNDIEDEDDYCSLSML